MKQFNRTYKSLRMAMPFFLTMFLFAMAGCEKDMNDEDFNPDFSFEYLDDNTVKFDNLSTGEYYWLIWDFANGTTDTSANKKESYEKYYSIAGDYAVTLSAINYVGKTKTITKTVSISNSNIAVSFTAEVDTANPNKVRLTNTTQGQYDSFKWVYRDVEVADEMEHLAYFPLAGDYDVQLVVYIGVSEFSDSQTINIAQDDPNYDPTLIWAEEFDYTGLPDATKWNMEIGVGDNGWGNNELQYYTDSENNAMVENGVLTITAREEEVGGRNYSSARITTQNKFDFKYGKIEARIKLPYGQGLWPAFWMLGANINSVSWPACGEIDIMELVGGDGGDNTCHSTLHWENAAGEHGAHGESHTLSSGIFADEFHVFSVEWDEQSVKAYVDDTQYFTIDLSEAQFDEFRQNFFIILNLAVGGNWPGSPDDTTVFPQTMQVDYVRVYQN